MELNIVEQIFNEFIKSKNCLLMRAAYDKNSIIIVYKLLEIIVSYDDREDKLGLCFNLKNYKKEDKKYNNSNQYETTLLDIDDIYRLLNLSRTNYNDLLYITINERLTILSDLLIKIWDFLALNFGDKNVINTLFQVYKKSIKEINQNCVIEYNNNQFNDILKDAKIFFKKKEYYKVIELLNCYKEKLTGYDNKMYLFSLKKITDQRIF